MRALLLSGFIMAGLGFGAYAQTGGMAASCRDGTNWSGTTRRGACSGHGGVQAFGTAPASANSAGTLPSAQSPTAAAPAIPASLSNTQRNTAGLQPGRGTGQVWVNSDSKVYHCPGDRCYGKTAHGSHMAETAAKAGAIGRAEAKPVSERVRTRRLHWIFLLTFCCLEEVARANLTRTERLQGPRN